VLDVGAGTGIGARTITEFLPGLSVLSLDRSAEMMRQGDLPPASQVVADMSDFELPSQVEAVVSGFDALNYLNYEQLAGFFRSAERVLVPDGRLVFDYSSPKVLREDWRSLEAVDHAGGYQLRRRHRYDTMLCRSESSLELVQDSTVLWHEQHIQYVYDTYEMYQLADRFGFAVELIRNLDGSPFSPASTTHLYSLRKAGQR
jgi:ubiquinone/menaquinone biosynthesis C-methylase UbiE